MVEGRPKLGEVSVSKAEGLETIICPSGKELDTFQSPEVSVGEGQRRNYYLVEWISEELTSLCPVTGHPDFCKLSVRYIPRLVCLELKSVKFYIESFRNEGHFYEELITLIYRDFREALNPVCLEVIGEFNTRGGIPEKVTLGVINRDWIEGC